MTFDPNALECPECHSDWKAGQIPVEAIKKGYYGHPAPCEVVTLTVVPYPSACTCPPRFYKRIIGIEYPYDHPDRYDGISEWRCPDCGTRWSRWTGEKLEPGESARRA